MKIGVNISIDVTNIDKEKLFEGKKGKYLDAVAFIDIDEADKTRTRRKERLGWSEAGHEV